MSTRFIDKSLPDGFVLVDNFRIEGLLGRGGFGTTYIATDIQLDCTVAIKEYNPSIAIRRSDFTIAPSTESNRESYSWGFERFLEEAQLLAKFHHPNIVKVRHVFRANDTAYIVMDYERGVSLLEKLDSDGLFTTDKEVLDVLLPIVDGLKNVHSRHFLHRDIKPHNVFLRTDGSPLLLDFGSARVQGIDATRTVHPGYTPIEQFEESNHEGPYTDIYSLGATMYHSIKGLAPPSALTRQTGIIMHDRDPYVPLSTDDISGRNAAVLVTSINTALAQDPTQRPQTIDEWHLPGYLPLETTPLPFIDTDPTLKMSPPEPAPRVADSRRNRSRLIVIAACLTIGCIAAYLTLQPKFDWHSNQSPTADSSGSAATENTDASTSVSASESPDLALSPDSDQKALALDSIGSENTTTPSSSHTVISEPVAELEIPDSPPSDAPTSDTPTTDTPLSMAVTSKEAQHSELRNSVVSTAETGQSPFDHGVIIDDRWHLHVRGQDVVNYVNLSDARKEVKSLPSSEVCEKIGLAFGTEPDLVDRLVVDGYKVRRFWVRHARGSLAICKIDESLDGSFTGKLALNRPSSGSWAIALRPISNEEK